jgi:hypothetical protein
LIADTIVYPSDVLRNLVQAFLDLGKTFDQVVKSALVQLAADTAKRALQVLNDLGKSALDILKTAAEVGASALALAFTIILEWFPGSYRTITPGTRSPGVLAPARTSMSDTRPHYF